MPTGSGLCSQFGFAAEVTAGTAVTVTKFHKHVTVGGDGLQLITVTDQGLGGCALVPTVDRTVEVGRTVARDVELNIGTRGLGLLLKQALGSVAAATQIGVTPAYRQIHWNGDVATKSLTVQFGFPETTAAGAVNAHTVNGAKISQWEISCTRDDLGKFRFSLDAWNEVTNIALAAATYPSGETAATINEALRWNCFSAKIGGTASVAAGLVSVASGVEILGCRGMSVKGVQPLRTDGRFSGGNGIKTEQLLAGGAFQDFTADLDIEYQSKTQIYDKYAAYDTVPLELTFLGKADIGSSNFGKLSVIFPKAKIDPAGINVTGPGGLENRASFKAYGDPAGVLPAIQVEYISPDTAL